MTEDEKEAIKAFIDSLHPVTSDAWRARALVAEKHLDDMKNTIDLCKGLKTYNTPNAHDCLAKLVFRWNESESLRTQLSEIVRKLDEVTYVTGTNPVERVQRLVDSIKNLDSRNSQMNKELSELKRYFLNLSEEFVRKSL